MSRLPPTPDDDRATDQSPGSPVQATEEETSASERRAALIQQTLALWQPRTSRKLTEEDAQQMIDNAVGVFRLLLQWRHEELMAEKGNRGTDDEESQQPS